MISQGSSFSSQAFAAWILGSSVSERWCFELLVLEAYVTAKPLPATACSVALANLDSSRGYDARSFSAILSAALGYFLLSSLSMTMSVELKVIEEDLTVELSWQAGGVVYFV